MSSRRKRHKTRHHGDIVWTLTGETNKHHNLAKSRGGHLNHENIFEWDTSVHRAFHFLFGNLTLVEAADWLLEIDDQNKSGRKLDLKCDAGEE